MQSHEIDYERRPYEGKIDTTMRTFMDIMDNISATINKQWSFVGGLPRDLYKGKPFNDYDVCFRDVPWARSAMEEMGVLTVGQYQENEIPHDIYHDPYSFTKSEVPIHLVQASDDWAFAPADFDFSISQICLKSDGYFYAPSYAWRDLDRGVIRKTGRRMTTSMAIRAIRFACKYDFVIDTPLNTEIKEFAKGPMGTNYLLRTCKKIIEEGNGEKAFKMMKNRGFPHMELCKTMEDYTNKLNHIIVTGQGHRERITGGHDY